jgi:hypothetical protein
VNEWLQIRRLRGPAFLVLIGIMFLLGEYHILSWERSWPLLLILFGLLKLAERLALSRIDPAQINGGFPAGYPPYPSPGVAPVSTTGPVTTTAIVPQHPGSTTDEGRP